MSKQSNSVCPTVCRVLRGVAIALMLLVGLTLSSNVHGQDISASISTTEGYVGSPIVLEIRIANVEGEYDLPEAFEIEGCDVQRSTPSQSSQITIFNGRRSESRSIGVQYFITPRRAGDFEIPEFTIDVDGKRTRIQAQSFSAQKSETGDLMFVEITGAEDSVFVGEPLELTLKIWLKPYAKEVSDRQIRFSEGQMWQTLSERSSWGKFESRMRELEANRQRPGGKTVLRTNADGEEDTYYLYEITTTIYPDRPGSIDASDLQIVADFPMKIGRQRDPFDSLLGSRAGASSLMRQMLNDDFFGSSPFRRGLSVTESRPITADVSVGSTRVLPVPTEGRPNDYRGAVGKYNIAVQANPTRVEAGAPITLQIGIGGDGPMELIQAPPLHETPSLTDDFKVSDQSLAGFVQGQSKVFVTSIRPRRAGITEIPPIPFSYFDPEKEQYVTVSSQPIPISVSESEALSLDAIVSNQQQGNLSGQDTDTTEGTPSKIAAPNLTHDFSDAILSSPQQTARRGIWFYFVTIPPLVWLVILFAKACFSLSKLASFLRSPKSVAEASLQSAASSSEAENTFIQYIARKTKEEITNVAQAMGVLRTRGLSAMANQGESLLAKFGHASISDHRPDANAERKQLVAYLNDLENALNAVSQTSIGKPRRRRSLSATAKGTGFLLALSLTTAGLHTSDACGQEPPQTEHRALSTMDEPDDRAIELTESQTKTLLEDANKLYQEATKLHAEAPLEARDLFERSAQKYQMLADVHPASTALQLNLGNAYLQSNKLGMALASYHRAQRLTPSNEQAAQNIAFIEQRLESNRPETDSTPPANLSAPSWPSWLQTINDGLLGVCGLFAIQIVAAIASIVFWLLVILRTCGIRIAFFRAAIIPLLILVASMGSLWLNEQFNNNAWGIVVTEQLTLRSGDGSEFEPLQTIENAEGLRVHLQAQRGNWLRVELADNPIGWATQTSISPVVPIAKSSSVSVEVRPGR